MSHEGNPFSFDDAPSTLRSAQLPASETRSLPPAHSGVRDVEDHDVPISISAWDLMVDPEDLPPQTVRSGSDLSAQEDAMAHRRSLESPVEKVSDRERLNKALSVMHELESWLLNATQGKDCQVSIVYGCVQEILSYTAASHASELQELDALLRPMLLRLNQRLGTYFSNRRTPRSQQEEARRYLSPRDILSHQEILDVQQRIATWLDDRQIAEHRRRIEREAKDRPAA